MKEIGRGAFAGCTGLTKVAIPARPRAIGAGAFAGCVQLTDIVLLDDDENGCFFRLEWRNQQRSVHDSDDDPHVNEGNCSLLFLAFSGFLNEFAIKFPCANDMDDKKRPRIESYHKHYYNGFAKQFPSSMEMMFRKQRAKVLRDFARQLADESPEGPNNK